MLGSERPHDLRRWWTRLARWVSDRWFYDPSEGWHPRHYEWHFTHRRSGTVARREEYDAIVPTIGAALSSSSGRRVLEVGSGTGCYTLAVARLADHVMALDCSHAMKRFLERRLRREGLSNVTVREGCLPVGVQRLGSFDGVVAVGVLNYVADLEASLTAIGGVLVPGGWAVLTVPAATASGRRYQRDELSTRRRVFLRTDAQIRAAADVADLRLDQFLTAGSFTRVIRLTRRGRCLPATGD